VWRLAAVLVALVTGALPAGEVRELGIEDPVQWWERHGYAGMVPSIHLPTTHDRDDLIHVWLKVPAGGRIDAEYLPGQGRWCLILPPGTRSDRTEYYRVRGPRTGEATHYLGSSLMDPADWTVADVRGTHVHGDGGQELHVLRPTGPAPHESLRGWAWPRGNGAAQEEATRRLIEHARTTQRPLGRGRMSEAGLAALRRLNDCAGCHVPRRDRVTLKGEDGRSIERATDNLGFFVPTAVLSDDCVVANHRPEDLNAEDPFVEVRCGERPAELVEEGGAERYTCPDGQVPIGYRDVRAGLAAGHPYTKRVCESRRWLFERMTERARRAYAEPLAACGIGGSTAARPGS
jgi:hypothetical protein